MKTLIEISSPVLKIGGFGNLEMSFIVDPKYREAAEGFVLGIKADKRYCAELKEVRDRRTMSQNGYYWALNNQLAERLRISPFEVYREHIINMAGVYDYVLCKEEAAEGLCENWRSKGEGWFAFDMGESVKNPKCRKLKLYRGSSSFDKDEMGRLIDLLIMDCEAAGIPTLSREEIGRMELHD